MRVLHLYKYFTPQFTGEGIFLERLAPVFARLAPGVLHEVAVTSTPAPDSGPPSLPGLAAVHYLKTDERRSEASGLTLLAWMKRHGSRFDVVHAHTHVDRRFLSYSLMKLRGRRLVLSSTLDDSALGVMHTYRAAFRPTVRHLLTLFDHHIAISPKLMEETTPFVGAKRCHRVPLGIPIPDLDEDERAAARARLEIDPSAIVLVSVGGLCSRKDQMFLVRQMPALLERCPTLLLMLVGPAVESSYQAEIEAFVRSHHLEDHVRLVGFKESPWDFYRASDLMVLASHLEGFGTVQIEAMSFGLPLVARLLPGVNDSFVSHGRTGFLFSGETAFRNHVLDLVADPELRRRIGEAARSHVISHFDIEVIARRYLRIYAAPPQNRFSATGGALDRMETCARSWLRRHAV